VAGNNLTALRTAAAAAAAARCLARKDSTHVAVLGTGRQAFFQVRALCEIRPIKSVAAWSRSMERTHAFGGQVRSLGLDFIAARTPAEAARKADIIVTVTPSKEPLIRLPDISPGAHINAMGSDTLGKRELSTDLLEAGRIWADDIRQASMIGECQHLASLVNVSDVGSLLLNTSAFERGNDEITIFDGTGLALQDLAAARLIMSAAMKRGCAQAISL
jgi:ornithine cyclodeaminase